MDTNHSELQNTETGVQNIIHFEEGILGFEDIREYLLYHEDESGIIWNLQAAHCDVPSFVVVDPYPIVNDYHPVFPESELAYFGEADAENLCVLVVAVIKPNLNESVINLKAPIVIDVNTKKAKQIILDNTEYPIRYKLFRDNR
ncbi:flagellar assembly protein FliW [Caproiciproducens faecalis]|uniref:Flagellar assembly factor FliW n=1 Tax=Caproiciproducens faecalis TaxID=2820301 RepID=A0ABS7DPV8_9FIRM|nr:flagellar assembly protein FliW [Caproiciproducens faecalis]MBW7573339.1 flagellar assembly protein FliW [Caproiciproducens faecalis]